MHVLTIGELLALRGLDLSQRIKLVRHSHNEQSLSDLRAAGLFDAYQAIQSDALFDCDVVVAFEAMQKRQARLIGVYQVLGKRPAQASDLPAGIRGLSLKTTDLFYELQRLDAFDPLSDRVIVDWGPAGIAWHQWLNDGSGVNGRDKPVIGLQEAGFMGPFPGYADLMLSFADLQRLVRHPDHNPEWHARLKAIRAIYLIQHRSSGRLYVGSATGSEGLWGRWSDYANTRHGGNQGLIELLNEDPLAHQDFVYSILRALPGNTAQEEVLRYESFEKNKLGTRVHGLTRN